MQVRLPGILLLCVLLSFGFTFGKKQENKKADSLSESSGQFSVPSPDANLSKPEILDMASEDIKNTSLETLPVDAQEMESKPEPLKPAEPPVASASGSGGGGMNMYQQLQVLKIQKQIKEIIKTNQSLRQIRQAQIAQIEQVTDQAKKQRKLLDEIEKQNKESADEIKSEEIDDIVKQEKMFQTDQSGQTSFSEGDVFHGNDGDLMAPASSDPHGSEPAV